MLHRRVARLAVACSNPGRRPLCLEKRACDGQGLGAGRDRESCEHEHNERARDRPYAGRSDGRHIRTGTDIGRR